MTAVPRGGRRRGGHPVPGPGDRGRDAHVSGWVSVRRRTVPCLTAMAILAIGACTSGQGTAAAPSSPSSVTPSIASPEATSRPAAGASPSMASTDPTASTPSPAASTRMSGPAPTVTPGRTPSATPSPVESAADSSPGSSFGGRSGGASSSSSGDTEPSGPSASPSAPAPDPSASVPLREVSVTLPADGATVSLPVVVEVEVTGFDLVELTGEIAPDEGHLWAFVDAEPPAERVRLPESRSIVTSSDRRIEVGELSPGKHTVTVVATHGYPIPFEPRVQDAVTFTVAG